MTHAKTFRRFARNTGVTALNMALVASVGVGGYALLKSSAAEIGKAMETYAHRTAGLIGFSVAMAQDVIANKPAIDFKKYIG